LKTLKFDPDALDTSGAVVPFGQLSELGFLGVKSETAVSTDSNGMLLCDLTKTPGV
jgi:hypothetical protein